MHTFLKRRKIPVFKSVRMRVDAALVTRSVFSRKLSLLQRLLGLLMATEKKKKRRYSFACFHRKRSERGTRDTDALVSRST